MSPLLPLPAASLLPQVNLQLTGGRTSAPPTERQELTELVKTNMAANAAANAALVWTHLFMVFLLVGEGLFFLATQFRTVAGVSPQRWRQATARKSSRPGRR